MSAFEWIFVSLLAVVYAPGVLALSRVWSGFDYYSHGYVVPFVALWAASAYRRVLPSLPNRRDPRGLWVLSLALLLYVLATLAGAASLIGLSLVLAVSAAVLYLRGAAWLRQLAFPLGYLLFMVPLPQSWLSPVIVWLQLLVSSTGVTLVRWLGQPVFREGNVIHLPGGESLFVAEACSGITSLVTLIPLGVLLAWLTEKGRVRRVLLVSTVLPVALAGNLVRVLATILVARHWGSAAAVDDALHQWLGLGTYVAACLVLIATGSLLRRHFGPAPAGIARFGAGRGQRA